MRLDRDLVRRVQRKLGVVADGLLGSVTLAAIAERLGCAATVRCVQGAVRVPMDGVLGNMTLEAVARVLGCWRDDAALRWPTQQEVRSGRSVFGQAGDESALVNVVPAYPLFFEGRQVRSIRVHRAVAAEVEAVLREVLAEYGAERIRELRLDVYGGSYAHRCSRGGRALSMHSWGIAFDFMPGENGLRLGAPEAVLSRPEYRRWWEIWEAHGAVSLGRERNYDWMHVQFARLDG